MNEKLAHDFGELLKHAAYDVRVANAELGRKELKRSDILNTLQALDSLTDSTFHFISEMRVLAQAKLDTSEPAMKEVLDRLSHAEIQLGHMSWSVSKANMATEDDRG